MRLPLLSAIIFTGLSGGLSLYAAAFEPTAHWGKSEVKVCWDVHPKITDASKVQALFRSSVTAEFTPERTGVHFTGWEDCASVGAVDAKILLKAGQPGQKTAFSDIGRAVFDKVINRYVPRTRKSGIPSMTIELPQTAFTHPEGAAPGSSGTWGSEIRVTAIHEFGHLAGLLHEHLAHSQLATKDPHCSSTTMDDLFRAYANNGWTSFPTEKGAGEDYDPNSFMSYCQVYQNDDLGEEFFVVPLPDEVTDSGFRFSSLFMPLHVPLHSVRLADRTIYEVTPAPTQDLPERLHVKVHAGLSAGDVKTLKHWYP